MRSFFRGRVLLVIVLLGAFGLTANVAHAQAAPTATASGVVMPLAVNPFHIIFDREGWYWDFVLWTITILSIFGVTLIIQGFIKTRQEVVMPEGTTAQIREMIQARQFKDLIDFTEADPSFVAQALHPALKRAPSFSAMKEAMETSIGEQTAEQFRKIEYLNIIGNLGPLLGLLGTVIGMIDAFHEMRTGAADPGKLAGGISTALTHTMLGLILAIPCLACFGILRTMVDRLTVRAALVAEELLLMIKPAEAKPTAAAPGARPAMAPAPAIRKAPIPAPPMMG